ncbi:TetR family transcriptional regulator [Chelatococcus daeguensis]|uniref:TetR family transcriptional regulator n=2 Tax=Chelatococcus TaxID=28209 RepID=A0AAC9NY65_9HYPH|nr:MULTISPECIES: TetR family transcriptional regulator [Chelatococcus]APF36246.1 TetR family transcriptional regulator [Chelatococcus daeguensis]KZE30569.1 TetR family transcriptional regulator [Chelatococcus daeguensis]MBM3081918.1 TetR family transcriptional regulator [Chelatococcus daeguensis]CUA89118.1 transcriptional regulator, TetR family [Chelatococcus sambhunathii]
MNIPRRAARTTPQTADVRLLDIAAEHVRRLGATRVTVVGVAQEAGMTHANVYRYFPSKRDLLDAVVQAALRPVETFLADVASAPDPADDKLERLILALARDYRDLAENDPPIFDLFVAAAEANRGVARRHRGRVRMFVGRVVDEGLATGTFNPKDREQALTFLTDILFRFTHPTAVKLDTERPRDMLEERLATTMRIALRALKAGYV